MTQFWITLKEQLTVTNSGKNYSSILVICVALHESKIIAPKPYFQDQTNIGKRSFTILTYT